MEQVAPTAAPRRRNGAEISVVTVEEDTVTPYEQFMKVHTQAYAATKEGTILDEQGFKDRAFNSYQQALMLIDKALQVSYGGGFSTEEVNKVEEIQYKMRMTRKDILERISDLQHSTSSSSYLDGPGAAEQAVPNLPVSNRLPPAYSVSDLGSGPASNVSVSGAYSLPMSPTGSTAYSNLASVLDEIAASQSAMPNPLPVNASEIFFIENEVQIYYIAPDGNVSAPSYPSFLRVVVLNEDETSATSQPSGFIQCGEWIYPLIKERSPMLRSEDGTYIFPDLTTHEAGCYVGLILPAVVSEEKRKVLEDTLLQVVGLSTFPCAGIEGQVKEPDAVGAPPKPAPRKLSSMIAEGLIQGVGHGQMLPLVGLLRAK